MTPSSTEGVLAMTAAVRHVLEDHERGLFKVHRSVFTSQEILDRERERIFDRAWLYVGHESEIKSSHDFRTRRVGGRTVIFTRDRQGQVRVLLNTCRHRGAEVCRETSGVFRRSSQRWVCRGSV
jgi:p-cumate 2,3-dioxygenase subunit alpha